MDISERVLKTIRKIAINRNIPEDRVTWEQIAKEQAIELNDLFAKRIVNCQREQLVCVDNANYDYLTIGKEYELLEESKEYYKIENDLGGIASMSKVRFEKVSKTNCS